MGENKGVFTDATRVSIYKFDPSDIVFKPELNGRHELPDIEWLVQDILKNGQIQPVLVRKDGTKAVLCAGFSRWRAIVEINKRKMTKEPLPILACYKQGNEVDGFVAGISENRFRNSTSELDDAYNIVRLRQYQMTDDSIAAIYFPTCNGDRAAAKKAIAWVKRRANLVSLTPEAQKAVRDGKLKPSAAAHLAKLSAEVQRKALKGKDKVMLEDVRKAEGKQERMSLRHVRNHLEELIADIPALYKPSEADKLLHEVTDNLNKLIERMKA